MICQLFTPIRCRLHGEAMKQAATDPTTGKVDMGILLTGISAGARNRRAALAASIRDFLQTKLGPGTYARNLIFEQFRPVATVVSLVLWVFFSFRGKGPSKNDVSQGVRGGDGEKRTSKNWWAELKAQSMGPFWAGA